MHLYDRGFLSDIYHILADLEEREVCTELSMRGQPFFGAGIQDYFVMERLDKSREVK